MRSTGDSEHRGIGHRLTAALCWRTLQLAHIHACNISAHACVKWHSSSEGATEAWPPHSTAPVYCMCHLCSGFWAASHHQGCWREHLNASNINSANAQLAPGFLMPHLLSKEFLYHATHTHVHS